MVYPLKTLSQLRPILLGFRKEAGLTQAALAERLGVSQQSYAKIEANPASVSMERLYGVLRQLNVEIILSPTPSSETRPIPEQAFVPAAEAKLKSGIKNKVLKEPERVTSSSNKKEVW